AYLAHLRQLLGGLPSRLQPDIVFYNAGVDPHAEDRLGRLSLTDEGLRRRDALVLSHCMTHGWPVACVIGGGYSRDIESLGRRHSIIHRVASQMWSSRAPSSA
ncbi:MAG: histone deacetylase, partial [Hyphomicrobiales bacterium]